ncbi:hypothetical protein Tco_0273781 [Tanacetum coccineum]
MIGCRRKNLSMIITKSVSLLHKTFDGKIRFSLVEVLGKSMKDLEQAREKDKELFEEAIEQERKLNKKKFETFKEEMKKETNDLI